MPQFRYTIHTSNGQVLTDTTIADSESDARYELENLGNTVLNIELLVTEPKNKRSFAFEASDASGKRVSGKIKSVDEESAHAKLVRGHHLTNVVLTEIKSTVELTTAQKQAILQQAQGVLIKASTMLMSIKSADPRHGSIAGIRSKIDSLISANDAAVLQNEIPNLLSQLQDIERTLVEDMEDTNKEEVIFSTEQLIEQVKKEAEELKKDTRFLALNTLLSEALLLSRWLLAFYAAYFVFAETVVAKRLNVPFADFLANSLLSPLLYKVTLAVLGVYLFCQIKLSLLESTFLPAILLAGVTGLLVVSLFMI